ncbi:MAG: DMT family transporter [Candidatus Acidiferrum sp.]
MIGFSGKLSFSSFFSVYTNCNDFSIPSSPVRINNDSGLAPSAITITIFITSLMMIWAINFLAGKITLHYLPPVTLGSIRIVVSATFMVLLAPLLRRVPGFQQMPHAPRPPFTGRDYWTFAYLGFFGFVVNQICFTTGLHYTSVAHSSFIVGMGPIYTLILAVLFGLERATWRKATGMAISLAGVVILASSTGMSPGSPTVLGDAITLCGSLGFAMWVVLGKRVAGRYDPITCTLWSLIFAALFILPLAIHQVRAFGRLTAWLALPWQAWAGVLFMTLFSSTLAYLIYLWLLRFVEASQLTAFSYLMPVAATVMSIVFLGERGAWPELFGGGLALAGIFWVESGRGR